jgi:hypothetical protein
MSGTIVTKKIRHMCDQAGRNVLGGYTGYIKDLDQGSKEYYWSTYRALRNELTGGRGFYTAACFPAL